MKTYKKIERKYTDEIIDTIECDICKKAFNGEWEEKSIINNILESAVSLEIGCSWGVEGGQSTVYSFDICPNCFREKLIPLIEKEFSAQVTETERDW